MGVYWPRGMIIRMKTVHTNIKLNDGQRFKKANTRIIILYSNTKLVYMCRTGFENGVLGSGPSLKMGGFRAATHGKSSGFWS